MTLDNPHWFMFDGEKIFLDWHIEGDFTGGEGIIMQTYLNIEPGEIFFDVGAAWPTWTLYALSKGARVYAFEPSKPHFEKIIEYVEANLEFVERCRVYNMALGNKEEIGVIADWCAEHGWHGETTPDSFIPAPMKKLDSFLPELEKLDWMKLDVEGGEYDILLGGMKTLEKFKPNLIIEDHSNVDQIGVWMNQNNILCKMIELVCNLGYGIHMHPHQGRAFLICTQGEK